MAERAGVDRDDFGEVDGRPVSRFTLRCGGLSAGLITFGAALQSLVVPDRDGRPADIVLGFDDAAGYAAPAARQSYLGAIVGRYAGRIRQGRFRLDGQVHQVLTNEDGNTLHGGPEGFDRRIWQAEPLDRQDASGVRFTLVSEHGDQGFAGRLQVTVDYLLEPAGRLRINTVATSLDAPDGPPTVVNLANHAYFHLGGEGSGSVEDHLLMIPASRYTALDAGHLPTGELAPVEGSPLDFRRAQPIGLRLRDDHDQLRPTAGYDHNWVLNPNAPVMPAPDRGTPSGQDAPLRLAAQALDPGSGRTLRIWTDQPGLQVFVANSFDGTMIGKSGRPYHRLAGFTAETQHFPDSPNQPDFPSTVLAAGASLRTSTVLEPGVDRPAP